jgi:hypothetical protein
MQRAGNQTDVGALSLLNYLCSRYIVRLLARNAAD